MGRLRRFASATARRILPGRLQRRLGLSSSLYDLSPRWSEDGDGSPFNSTKRVNAGFSKQDFRELGRTNHTEAVVDRNIFTACMGGLICINLISIGLETDMREGSWPAFFSYFNGMFLLAYVAELLLRLLTHGPDTLRDKLTALDMVLVSVSFVERYLNNSGFARALPAFRLLRVLRLLQRTKELRSQRELWVLVVSGNHAILTLGWMCLMLLVLVMGCSSFTKYAIGNSSAWNGTMDPMISHEPFESFDNHEYFGSVSRSFLTLLQIVTLSQWGDIVRRVILVYPWLFLFFLCFVGMTAYGITLVVISNIVEDCLAAARVAAVTELELERETRKRFGDQVAQILRMVNRAGDGELLDEEIDRALAKTGLRALLDELSAPDLDGHGFVRLFDRLGSGAVGVDVAVDGLVAMSEDIKPKDYVKLAMWTGNLLMRAKALSKKVGGVSEKVAELRVTLEKAFEALEYYQQTRANAELRGRAIKEIRNSAPPEMPKLAGWKPPVEPKFPPEDEAKVFMNFAGRCLGFGSRAPQPGELSETRRGELAPAPPRLEVDQARAKEESEKYGDKYWPARDPEKDGMFGPSPSFKRIRSIIR